MGRILWIAGSVWVAIGLVIIVGVVLFAVAHHGPETLLVVVNPFEPSFWTTWLVWLAALSPGLISLGAGRYLETRPPP